MYKEYISKASESVAQRYYNRRPLAFVRTFGCQQNLNDSEKIKGILSTVGYGFCNDAKDADLVLYNTCAIREHAENRVYGHIGILKEYKQRKKGMIIALCGCMTQQPHIAEKIKESYPYVDLVFGTDALQDIPKMLYTLLTTRKRLFSTKQNTGEITENLPICRDDDKKAWVSIMYGCNNYCAYCIVPYVRGRERSRRTTDIVDEVRQLADSGCQEITLLGQNVNSYKSPDEGYGFPELLRTLNNITGRFTLNFMTSHPKDAYPGLIDAIAECDKVLKHLHLPVQSGSDRILAAMNRKYTAGEYLRIIEYARSRIPDITFSSDIIVGFPGEDYEDFLSTLDLIKKVRFKSLFTFIYSARAGTAAAGLEDKISKKEKTRWFMQMLDLQKEIEEKKLWKQ
ncbi:MAG: tRNA (N6-isopentenyl adenosine(37)-C2)-methylthiotransferase MiaB [Oscillospiraceae bacterium]|nr:tRNA (N6-isopentenyl adenosine(37)-C2)-methylthiotransferase MiaB [Oscillospiraceae bacterium]